jgi:hypothetical protein
MAGHRRYLEDVFPAVGRYPYAQRRWAIGNKPRAASAIGTRTGHAESKGDT